MSPWRDGPKREGTRQTSAVRTRPDGTTSCTGRTAPDSSGSSRPAPGAGRRSSPWPYQPIVSRFPGRQAHSLVHEALCCGGGIKRSALGRVPTPGRVSSQIAEEGSESFAHDRTNFPSYGLMQRGLPAAQGSDARRTGHKPLWPFSSEREAAGSCTFSYVDQVAEDDAQSMTSSTLRSFW